MVLQTVPGDFKGESAATLHAVGRSERLSRARTRGPHQHGSASSGSLSTSPGPGGGSRITLPGPLHVSMSEDKKLVSYVSNRPHGSHTTVTWAGGSL